MKEWVSAKDEALSYEHEYFSLKLNQSKGVSCPLPTGAGGRKQFTFMAWLYLSDMNTVKSCVSQQDGMDFGIENDTLYFRYGEKKFQSESVLIRGIWNHVTVVVYDSLVQLFLNGSLAAMEECADATLTDKPVIIGRDYFGYVRNVMLYQKALITDEILDKMYSVVVEEDVVLCCDFTKNPPVEQKSGKKLDLEGGASIVRLMPVAVFGDYSCFSSMESRTVLGNMGNYPFTIQTWLNFAPDDEQNYYVILSNIHAVYQNGFEIGLIRRSDGFHICVYFGDADNAVLETGNPLSERVWCNIAVVYEDSKLKVYINGALAETSPELKAEFCESNVLLIGARHSLSCESGEYWYHGYIARMDIWHKVLSAEELKNYAEAIPLVSEEALASSWEFFQDSVLNGVTGIPLNKINTARISLREETAGAGTNEICRVRLQEEEVIILPQDIVEKARAESGILEQMHFLQECTADDVRDKVAARRPKLILVNSCVYQNRIYFLHHDEKESYPITYIEGDIDEVTAWSIELVLIILEGILSYFLSLKISRSRQLAQFIRTQILPMAGMGRAVSVVAGGGSISAGLILSVIKEFLFSGKFTQVMRMAVSLSFWGLVSFVAGFVRKLAGGAADIILWAGMFTVQLAIHWKRYPQKAAAAFQLESVLFCHDRPGKICAIHVRRSERQTWELPEWKRGREEGDNAPAVYRLARFKVNEDLLEIQAAFRVTNTTNQTITYHVRADGGELFGMSDTETFICPPGTAETYTGFFRFPDAGELLEKCGINKQELSLSWEYQNVVGDGAVVDALEFIRFHLSKHQIYTILDSVNAPWGRTERTFENARGARARICYPMTEVYDATIDIVRGISALDAAKEAIVNHIYSCGGYKYYGLSSLMMAKLISLPEFLDYITSPVPGQPKNVNCEDCTVLTGAIANLYGCHLTWLYLGTDYEVREMLLIGEDEWRLPAGGAGEGRFDYHCLAVDGAYNGQIPDANFCYDSCFKYRGNHSNQEKLAVRERFCAGNLAEPNEDTYKESVCTQNGLAECEAIVEGEFAFWA